MESGGKELKMALAQKRWIILLVIAVVAFLLGRLAVRAFMNLLMRRHAVRRQFSVRNRAKEKKVKAVPVGIGDSGLSFGFSWRYRIEVCHYARPGRKNTACGGATRSGR